MGLHLERLVYQSTATGRTASLQNLVVILSQSQRNNDRDGLTGALAAHRDRFIQVVEGPAQALDALLRRLAGDPRHTDIRLLGREPVAARSFADWSMASAAITPSHGEALDGLLDQPDATPRLIIQILRDALDGEPRG